MYPQRELIRLAAHKTAVRRCIAVHRLECVVAVTRVARPFAWLDRVMGFWRQLSPFAQLAALPLGVFFARKFFPRLKTLGALLRWAPLVTGAVRALSSAGKARP